MLKYSIVTGATAIVLVVATGPWHALCDRNDDGHDRTDEQRHQFERAGQLEPRGFPWPQAKASRPERSGP